MRRLNFPYDDKSKKGVDFTFPSELQHDLFYDDLTDYHPNCVMYGRSGYYRMLYWTLEQLTAEEHYDGMF